METKNIFEFDSIFGYLLLNFFFDPLGVGHMSCTSKSYARRVTATNYYKLWLQRNENGVFHDPGRASSVSYFAAQLFRCFLRKLQFRFGDAAVVAGGLAVNYFLNTPSFANDIDIFVTSKRHREHIVLMYIDSVLKPLKTKALIDYLNLVYIQARYENERALQRKLIAVRQRIQTDIEEFILDLNIPDTDNASNVNLATLRDTPDNLPKFLAPASYKVRESIRLSPIQSTLARPLNIIVVWVDSRHNAAALARTICTSFDLQHCAISFKTAENFSFKYDCFDRSQDCALQRRLELQPTSFLGPGLEEAIMIQLKRIWKYIQQGYTWSGYETSIS